MALGLMGRKVGMTQVNNEAGLRMAGTVIEVGPCIVMQKKTPERDGYSALKIAFGERKPKRTPKAQRTQYEKIKTTPKRFVREFRMTAEEVGKFTEGQEIGIEGLFTAGQYVDVIGKTKGRGFTGVVKKWGMKGNRATHGTHEFWRHGGSIGTRTWPGNVHKGKKMGGHYGDERVTIQNLPILSIIKEKNCILVGGAIPGAPNGLIEIRPAATHK